MPHSRAHHRLTHKRWRKRRHRRLSQILWFSFDLRPQDYDTHAPKRMWGKKRKDDRRIEERRFRQRVRRALHHGDPVPRYRHDWAD